MVWSGTLCCLVVGCCAALISAAVYPTSNGGGYVTDIRIYPYVVQIENKGRYRCSGVILDKEHVLTTAHCVRGIDVSALTVRAGTVKAGSGGTLHKVRSTAVHPEYVAVVEVADSFDTSDTVAVCNMSLQRQTTGNLTLLMWQTNEVKHSSNLQYINVSIVSRDPAKEGTDSMLLAGKASKEVCFNDNTGPAVLEGQVVGFINSKCVGRGQPVTIISLDKHQISSFIEKHTKHN